MTAAATAAEVAEQVTIALHGHWGGQQPGHRLCGCDIPPRSPASRMEPCQIERYTQLIVKHAFGPLLSCERDELVRLHAIAYPTTRSRRV